MSSSPSPVLSAEERRRNYWFDDGVPTLITGLCCVLGTIFFAYDHSDNSTPFTIAACLLALLLYVLVLLFRFVLTEWLKTKITYPRTGYAYPPRFEEELFFEAFDVPSLFPTAENKGKPNQVNPPSPYPMRRLLTGIALMTLGLSAMARILIRWIYAPIGFALALAFAVWFFGRRVQRVSLQVLMWIPAMAFFWVTLPPKRESESDDVIYFLAGLAVLFILDGSLTLFRYLRANPRPKQS